jgi:RNA polymerase sigma factor (sigma-70 family)
MESEAQVSQIVEHLFRQEAGKITSALTGSFGLRNLELIEDSVQEALLKALRLWSYGNIPPNPPAWLMQVARNHALDNLRRSTRWHEKEEEIARQQQLSEVPEAEPIFADKEIKDDQLRMIFACCHPALARESQVALTLKLLCGFNVEEIARAFITKSETIAKRLTRARERLRTDAVPFEIPSGLQLGQRLDAVLDVLYLLFNEGYNASQGHELIRRDLCDEAIRLTNLLAEHPAGDTPKTHALLALLLLQAARFSARIDARGEILILQDQDRTSWDRKLMSLGMLHLGRAAGDSASEFHLQAGIAACHCADEVYEATDWQKIILLYDLLLELNDSAVIALNRAVALSKVHGPNAGLTALNKIKSRESLKDYYLFHAVLGEFQLASNHSREAESSFRHALSLTNIPTEQNFLRKRLRRITS